MKKGKDIPGNAMGSQAAYQKAMLRLAEVVMRTDDIVESMEDDEYWILDIKVRFKGGLAGGHMSIVRADSHEGPVVAFHEGDSFWECLRGTIARLENRSMKWREDKWRVDEK